MKKLMILFAVTAFSGCLSTPDMHYYTLDMMPSGNALAAVNIVIDRLRTVEPLTRKDILIRTAPTRIEYYATEQWAAALDELVTEKLMAEFGPRVEGRKTLVITGLLQAFEQVDTASGAEAGIKMTLQFQDLAAGRYSEPLLEKTYTCRVQTQKANAAAVVEALSHGLEKTAAEIAADAAAL
jgi:uncharacterized lipoprotein YmbA